MRTLSLGGFCKPTRWTTSASAPTSSSFRYTPTKYRRITPAAKHGVPIYKTEEETLTLGTGKLVVDGVLLVAEHGKYPMNATGNTIYPKRRLFDAVQKNLP